MTEVEKAIKHFESLQKRYTTQHNGKQCKLVETALDALRSFGALEAAEKRIAELEDIVSKIDDIAVDYLECGPYGMAEDVKSASKMHAIARLSALPSPPKEGE